MNKFLISALHIPCHYHLDVPCMMDRTGIFSALDTPFGSTSPTLLLQEAHLQIAFNIDKTCAPNSTPTTRSQFRVEKLKSSLKCLAKPQ